MSMWQGHPILAEIRQGFKLRPTQTVDKSKPVIEAEDEELPQIKFERRSPPPVLYISQPKAQSKSICRVPQEALNIVHTKHRPISPNILNPPPRVPRPPSAPPKNTALLKLGGEIKDRTALLNSIKGGIKLRKAVTNDKSGLILDEEQKALLATRSGTGTPGSSLNGSQETLDSQGYSSLTPPSVHSAEDDESFNSRFSDSESESFYQPPPPPPPIFKANICLANAPPPPPPPPMAASTSTFVPKSAPPPPPPLMPMSAPPPPPPPMPMSSFSMRETQEKTVAFEPERTTWQPKPKVVKEEPKKADAVFDEDSLKVSKEKVEAEIKKGTAASRIAAFAKMAESTGGGAVFPKPLGPLVKNPPKRATEAAAAAEKPVEVKSSSTTKKAEEKPKSSSSSSKTLVTKEEVKIHTPKDGKVEIKSSSKDGKTSSSSSSSKPKTAEKSSSEKSSDAKKSSSSKSSSSSTKTGDSADKPKTSSSSTKSSSSSSSKDKPKTSSSSSTKTSDAKTTSSKTTSSGAKSSSTATKYSVPITVKTDHDHAPPIPKSQPPVVSPSSGKHFKEPTESSNNTSLGPYNYKGKSTPSPGSHSSISPNSGSYHTAISSATSSYSSVPETRNGTEKLSPVPSIASSSTSPRSTASGESSKENHSLESPFSTSSRLERGATQHSRNFEKLRQSFGAKTATENGDANNNGNSLNNGTDSVSSNKKTTSTMASRSSPAKNTSVPINAPWYNKKDYPEDEKTTSCKNSSKDPESMNPEEMRGSYKFKIDLKKKHPIDIIQR